MKGNAPVLYPNEIVGERVSEYSTVHSTSLPKHITDYHAHMRETQPAAEMMISIFQAQAMVFLAKMTASKRVLEVGVYVGLSSLMWNHAVGPEGKVTGLEFDPEYAKIAQQAYDSHGLKNVEVIVGDALESLPKLSPEEPYDIIFIDAQKDGYPQYLETILAQSQPGQANRLLRPGGLIMADNILRRGFVADDSEDNPWGKTKTYNEGELLALRKYNDRVSESERLENFLVPLWDGLNIARLMD